jgi:hypothetical protein
LGNPGVPKSIPILFANGTPAGCVPVVGETYENVAVAVANAGSGAIKGVKKIGAKKLVNKQLSGAVVPPRSASASSIIQPSAPPVSANTFANSPSVSRPLPPPATNEFPNSPSVSRVAPVPPRSNGSASKIPPPPERANKLPASDPPANDESKSKYEDRVCFFFVLTCSKKKRYASPALLPVKSKPPSVDRASKPATPVLSRRDSGASQIVYVSDVVAPEGVSASMLPGVRSAPPSRALHPELHEPAAPAADPSAPVINPSMQPGYKREFDLGTEAKRVLDPRRHNPVKNTKKKIAVSTPSGSDLKQTFKNIF